MKSLLFLTGSTLLLASCASVDRSVDKNGNFVGGTPPEGYVFEEGEDGGNLLDFRGLLDDEAWAAREKKMATARTTSKPAPTKPTFAATKPSSRTTVPTRYAPPKPGSSTVVTEPPRRSVVQPAPSRTAAAPRPTPKPQTRPPAPKPPAASRVHVVAKGDTLWGIGQKYGVSPEAIRQLNQLANDRIYVGHALRVPASGTVARPPASRPPATHVVRRGDTLWGISQKHGITVALLKSANRLTSDVLQPGAKLMIPRG